MFGDRVSLADNASCSYELLNFELAIENFSCNIPDDAILDVDITVDNSVIINNLAILDQQSVLRALKTNNIPVNSKRARRF